MITCLQLTLYRKYVGYNKKRIFCLIFVYSNTNQAQSSTSKVWFSSKERKEKILHTKCLLGISLVYQNFKSVTPSHRLEYLLSLFYATQAASAALLILHQKVEIQLLHITIKQVKFHNMQGFQHKYISLSKNRG